MEKECRDEQKKTDIQKKKKMKGGAKRKREETTNTVEIKERLIYSFRDVANSVYFVYAICH